MDSPRDGQDRRRFVLRVTLGVLGLGVVLRLLLLDADPRYEYWAGYLTDEGRWTEQARRLVLFGSLNLDAWLSRAHLALAPLFQLATAVSFALFGVGFTGARLVSAVSGILLLVSSALFLRRRYSPEGLLLTTVVLALQPDLLFMSRTAIPEVPSVLFQCLAFFALTADPGSKRGATVGGLLTAAALGFKATSFPVVPVFAVVAWTVGRGDRWSRWTRVGWFMAALAIVPFAAMCGALAVGAASDLTWSWTLLTDLKGLVEPNTAFGAAALLFDNRFAAVVNVLLLAAWVLAGLLYRSGPVSPSGVRDVYVGSSIWIVGWVGAASILGYFPLYYFFQVFVPIALNLGAGLTLLQSRASEADRADPPVPGDLRRRRLATIWLTVPVAVLLARLAVSLVGALGVVVDRFSQHLMAIALLQIALSVLALRAKSARLHQGFVLFPFITVLAWSITTQLGVVDGLFWASRGTRTLTTWTALIVLSATATVLGLATGWLRGPLWRWTTAFVLALSCVWLIRTAPKFAFPSHTIVDTAAAVAGTIGPNASVGTNSAAGLFLETRIDVLEIDSDRTVPDYFVVAGVLPLPAPDFYRLERTYVLRLDYTPAQRVEPNDRRREVRIYRRVRSR